MFAFRTKTNYQGHVCHILRFNYAVPLAKSTILHEYFTLIIIVHLNLSQLRVIVHIDQEQKLLSLEKEYEWCDKIVSNDHIYPTPPLGQDMTQGQFLSRV